MRRGRSGRGVSRLALGVSFNKNKIKRPLLDGSGRGNVWSGRTATFRSGRWSCNKRKPTRWRRRIEPARNDDGYFRSSMTFAGKVYCVRDAMQVVQRLPRTLYGRELVGVAHAVAAVGFGEIEGAVGAGD